MVMKLYLSWWDVILQRLGVFLTHGWGPGLPCLGHEALGVSSWQCVATHSLLVLHHETELGGQGQKSAYQPAKCNTKMTEWANRTWGTGPEIGLPACKVQHKNDWASKQNLGDRARNWPTSLQSATQKWLSEQVSKCKSASSPPSSINQKTSQLVSNWI